MWVCVSVCVALPPLLAGVRWRAGHVTGCQLAFYWSSHTVHNITISWWGTLKPVSAHTLWSAALMSHGTLRPCQLQSTWIYKDFFFFLPSFGLIFTLKYHFPSQGVESIQNVRTVLLYKTSTRSEVLNIYFLLSRHWFCFFVKPIFL